MSSRPTPEHRARPELVVVAAVAEAPGGPDAPGDRLIGDGLRLPWHLPADLRHFKALTLGHPLVMGRRTFESLVHQFGGPLPGRTNAVLTRHPDRLDVPEAGGPEAGDVRVFGGLGEAVAAFADRPCVFVGGGAGVYASVLDAEPAGGAPVADRLELTFVEGTFEGDTFFPPYRHLLAENGGPYRRTAREAHPAADGRPAFRFETFVRDGRGDG